jgi:hypothetical protein
LGSNIPANYSGICEPACLIRASAVHTGMSNLLLAGERYINPDNYFNGTDSGDDQGWDMGYDLDTNRWAGTSFAPMQDTPGYDSYENFGSAHPSGFAAVFCDGSVHKLSYAIDPTTIGHMANRNSTMAIDPTKVQ